MRLTTVRVVAIALVIGVTGFWLLRESPPRGASPTSGQAIIAFGDSLVEGRGATQGRDFISLLSTRLGRPIINAGRSGDTTGAALARLESDVLEQNPRVVIVLLGGNDFLRRVSTADAFANLETIVERIRARGAAVLLVGVAVGLFTDPYYEEYERLARRTSAGLVPDVLDGILGHADLMSDSIHPNDRGYEMVADRVEPALRQLLDDD
jgi:lysophospholipase L1-like esterase